MNLEVRTYQHIDGKHYFDIVNTDVPAGSPSELPELVHSDGKGYHREATAERNGQRWIEKNEVAQ